MKGRVGQTWATVGLGDEVIFVVVRSVGERGAKTEHTGLILQGGHIRLGKTSELLAEGKLHVFGESYDWENTSSLKRIA